MALVRYLTLLLAFFSLPAFATGGFSTQSAPGCFPSRDDACQARCDAYTSSVADCVGYSVPDNATCRSQIKNLTTGVISNSDGQIYSCTYTGTPACPTGEAWNGSSCVSTTCPTGQYWDAATTSCVTDNPCAALSGTTVSGTISATSNPTTVGFNGCEAKVVEASNQCAVGGVQKICGTWQYTGSAAPATAPVATSSTTPQVSTCPTGQSLGEFNGIKMCLPSGTDNPKTTTSTTTNPDGTKTTTTVTDNGTTTTTTSTTTDASGNTTGSTTTANYNKESRGSASADCGTAPVCAGDPIQCAILNQEWQTTCAAKTSSLDATNSSVQVGQQAIADGTNLPSGVTSTTTNLSNTLDKTGFLSGGGCVPDQVVSMGQFGSFAIPFSQLCWVFDALGALIITIAGLASAKIVGVI